MSRRSSSQRARSRTGRGALGSAPSDVGVSMAKAFGAVIPEASARQVSGPLLDAIRYRSARELAVFPWRAQRATHGAERYRFRADRSWVAREHAFGEDRRRAGP